MKKIINAFLTIAILSTFTTVKAQVVDPVNKNKIANGGYDVVSYFTDNAAQKGDLEYTVQLKGVKYQFATEEHQKLFKNNPEKYLPVCNGYCAWGVAEKGKKVPVNPETFKIINGKLYLFFNGDFNGSPFNTLPEWNKNEDSLLKQLPVKWAKLNKDK
jgi:YHS domain-containing protein